MMRAVKKVWRWLLAVILIPICLVGVALYLCWVYAGMAFDEASTRLALWQLRRQQKWLLKQSQKEGLSGDDLERLAWLHQRLTKRQLAQLAWLQERYRERLRKVGGPPV